MAAFYVAANGNDTGAGTQAAPWATLQHAADAVGAGDVVNVLAGNYRGFDIRHSGTAAARITFKGQAGATINQSNTLTGKDGINIENASYITIDGFKVVGTGNPATSRTGIRIVGDGFDNANAFSQNVIIQNNVIDNWGVWEILTGFCDDILIQNNVCSNSQQQHGIYFSNSGDRPIIRNNTCFGNAACGIQLNADLNTGNTALPGVDGITTGAVIENNLVYGNGGGSQFAAGGGAAINCDGVQNSTFQNNVLYDNHASGLVLYKADGGGPSSGNFVANNTIMMAANARYSVLIASASVNNTLLNNIIYDLNTATGHGSVSLAADSKNGFKSDYNLLDPRFDLGGANQSLAQWQTATGGDAHSKALTAAQLQALFTNYAGHDFTLANGSAAVDAGAASITNGAVKSAPTKDRIGTTRPQGAQFDVGAYERTAAAAQTPEAAVRGNGIEIADGDSTPSTSDGTDFGSTAQGSAGVERTFTIANTGNANLNLGAFTAPAGFSFTASPTNPVLPNTTTTFKIRLNATNAGTFAGDIVIANNDANENPYNFRVSGTVTPAATTAVTSLTLINAGTDQTAGPVSNGQTINLANFPGGISLRAETSGSASSVRFTDNGTLVRTENIAPFDIAGDNGSDYLPWSTLAGVHTVVATPFSGANASGAAGAALTLNFTITQGSVNPTPVRVNAGGGTFSAGDGTTWQADNSFTGGEVNSTTYDVLNTTDDALYGTRRFGKNFSFSKAVVNGNYTLKLLFAESYWTGVGQRKFDVFAEGKLILDDLDLVAAAGAKKAYARTFAVSVNDGKIDLSFAASIDNAIISGIELVPA